MRQDTKMNSSVAIYENNGAVSHFSEQGQSDGTNPGVERIEEDDIGQHPPNRYQSFAPTSTGDVKWYVDGCSYFWAVSESLEQAKEEILILDWWLSPELYLRRPPSQNEQYRVDNLLKAAAERGVKVYVIIYKEVESAIYCNSRHTKEALEGLHPSISVFRHPDHALDKDKTDQGPSEVDQLHGSREGKVVLWTHHEKALVIDRSIGFMGGQDLCFGRYDTNSHPIADVHPNDPNATIFPGQDYNNARLSDFHDVGNWNQNKLDRTKSPRMGWSDVGLSMQGPIVDSLVCHFVQKWNFLLGGKYRLQRGERYGELQSRKLPAVQDDQGALEPPDSLLKNLDTKIEDEPAESRQARIQLVRSVSDWSFGLQTENSIMHAYADAIANAEHFIYIENQIFVTATSKDQGPVQNDLGAIMVERILRAHREQKPFKIWVVMPALPGFAGDLHSMEALGMRALMEFQYASISRGKHSVFERLRQHGIDDHGQYISFYNLRSFDRINTSKAIAEPESKSGEPYERGYKWHDHMVGVESPTPQRSGSDHHEEYKKYQHQVPAVKNKTLDTISACYMADGGRVSEQHWDGGDDKEEEEMNAYVSEQLYVHTKLLIADDRLVICGSANLNDRSMLGNRDTEIAVVIEDPNPIDSYMSGNPYKVSRFASSLRRFIFRRHLGLLPHQHPDRPDTNFTLVDHSPNDYDWGSREDRMVEDPLHTDFARLWSETARTNTEVFARAFHHVPNNKVRTWQDYDEFFSKRFFLPGEEVKNQEGQEETHGLRKVGYGHVVREEFPGGVRELKEFLDKVRGSLVNMPLDFLDNVDDSARHLLQLDSFTEQLFI